MALLFSIKPSSTNLLRQTFSDGPSPSDLLRQIFSIKSSSSNLLQPTFFDGSYPSDLLRQTFSSPSDLLQWAFSSSMDLLWLTSSTALNPITSTPSWNTSEALDNVTLSSTSDRIKYIFITSLVHMTYML